MEVPSAPPPDEPWHFGPEPVYKFHVDHNQALQSATHAPTHKEESAPDWHEHRKKVLKEWGQKREAEMHRPPKWCMDQLCSGSGLFPPRHLADDWFTPDEQDRIRRLEQVLKPTGHEAMLAKDMMALKIFDIDIRIIADDSYSMNCGMIGGYAGSLWNGGGGWSRSQVQKVFGKRAFSPADLEMFRDCPFPPSCPRWTMLIDALRKWEEVFNIIGVERKVYLLNGYAKPHENLESILAQGPCGGTPMGNTFARVLNDYQSTGRTQDRPLLILALTDGEASDKDDFNNILDEIQDGLHGDVQVCLMGLSLQPEDIEWFEAEECDDTRIRTIEAYEVEQQMILYRKVIQKSTDYNFAMHTYRALVTNFFPADYDYEAPIQTLRHRLYITLHALDRRFTGNRDATYSSSMPITPASVLSSCAPVAVMAGMFAGPKYCACVAFLGLVTAAGVGTRQGGQKKISAGAVSEECLTEEEDRLIGSLIQGLQFKSTQGRQSQYRTTGGYGGGYGRGYGGGYGGYQQRPYIPPMQLSLVQNAIGTLNPSETQMRDLQFQDVSYNNRALQVALVALRKAATSEWTSG